MSSILNNFGVNWMSFLAYLFDFILIYFLLQKFAFKPILAILDKRKKIIKESLANAEAIEKQREEMEIEYKKVMSEANAESKKIIQESMVQAENIAKEINEEARAEATKTIMKARDELKVEKQEMYDNLKGEIKELITLTLSKVLKDSLTHDEQKRIIQKSIDEIK